MPIDRDRRHRWAIVVAWWVFGLWVAAVLILCVIYAFVPPANDLDFNPDYCPPAVIKRLVVQRVSLAVVLAVGPIVVACLALVGRRRTMAIVFVVLAALVALPATVMAKDSYGMLVETRTEPESGGRCLTSGGDRLPQPSSVVAVSEQGAGADQVGQLGRVGFL